MLTLMTVFALNLMINAFQYRHWPALAGVIGWIVFVFVVGHRRRAHSMME